jgi:hypothetical protein
MVKYQKSFQTRTKYQPKCRHLKPMDVKFTKICPTFIPWENILWGLAPYVIPNIYIFQKPITIVDLENKMWGHGINTLKFPKLLSQSTIFCISKFWQDVYTKLDENIGEIWKVKKLTYWIF